jgi:hypothetical protein
MSVVRGQISGSLAKTAHAPPSDLQRAWLAGFFRRDELKASPQDFRFRTPGGSLESLEQIPVLFAEAGVHVSLHASQCSTRQAMCATQRDWCSGGSACDVVARKDPTLDGLVSLQFVPAAATTSAFVSGLSGFGGCAGIHVL